jgi:hypothetical protein
MKLRYDIPEIVWNSYEVRGIELGHLKELLKKQPNIWIIQSELALKGIHIGIELEEACFEFIESLHDKGELQD